MSKNSISHYNPVNSLIELKVCEKDIKINPSDPEDLLAGPKVKPRID